MVSGVTTEAEGATVSKTFVYGNERDKQPSSAFLEESAMNARVFRRNVLGVIFIYTFAVGVGICLKIVDPSKDAPVYGTFKDLIPLIIAIPAAWLGYCFQRRQAYLKDVRDIWSKMCNSFQDAVQYTHLQSPSQEEYAKVLKSLSYAIEEMRAVFANVGEDEKRIGIFPFESMKLIRGGISSLGFSDSFQKDQAPFTRSEIVERWKVLRKTFLLELERDIPMKVDSPFLS